LESSEQKDGKGFCYRGRLWQFAKTVGKSWRDEVFGV